MFTWIAVWLGPFVVMIPINISIHLKFPVQKKKKKKTWVILWYRRKVAIMDSRKSIGLLKWMDSSSELSDIGWTIPQKTMFTE